MIVTCFQSLDSNQRPLGYGPSTLSLCATLNCRISMCDKAVKGYIFLAFSLQEQQQY
jgi:hypothetical protein